MPVHVKQCSIIHVRSVAKVYRRMYLCRKQIKRGYVSSHIDAGPSTEKDPEMVDGPEHSRGVNLSFPFSISKKTTTKKLELTIEGT